MKSCFTTLFISLSTVIILTGCYRQPDPITPAATETAEEKTLQQYLEENIVFSGEVLCSTTDVSGLFGKNLVEFEEDIKKPYYKINLQNMTLSECKGTSCQQSAITTKEYDGFLYVQPSTLGALIKIARSGDFLVITTDLLTTVTLTGTCQQVSAGTPGEETTGEPEETDPSTEEALEADPPAEEVVEPEPPQVYKGPTFFRLTKTEFNRTSSNSYYIYGETSPNCTAVIAEAKNTNSRINDIYQLKEYKYGDTDFRYGIREDWSNLGPGTNVYTLKAYCDGGDVIEQQYVWVEPYRYKF